MTCHTIGMNYGHVIMSEFFWWSLFWTYRVVTLCWRNIFVAEGFTQVTGYMSTNAVHGHKRRRRHCIVGPHHWSAPSPRHRHESSQFTWSDQSFLRFFILTFIYLFIHLFVFVTLTTWSSNQPDQSSDMNYCCVCMCWNLNHECMTGSQKRNTWLSFKYAFTVAVNVLD